MAQTFGQFINECALYPFSAENYNFMKECGEITLMERYLENQQFVAECVDTSAFTEGYLMEFANSETVTTITEAFKEKVKNIKNDIYAGVKRVLTTVKRFFMSIINKIDPLTRSAEKVLAALRKKNLTDEDIKSIYNIIMKCGSSDKSQKEHLNVGYAKQPFLKSLKLSYETGVSAKTNSQIPIIENFIAAMCTSSVAMINTDANIVAKNNSEQIGAISADELVKCVTGLIKCRKGYDVESVLKTLEGSYEKTKRDGFPINVNTGVIDKLVKKLEDAYVDIEQLSQNVDNQTDTDVEVDTKKDDAEYVNQLRAAYSKINACVASTLKVYSDYVRIRKNFITAMSSYLNTSDKVDSNKSSDE